MRYVALLTVAAIAVSTAYADDRAVPPGRPLPGGQAGAPGPGGIGGKRGEHVYQVGPLAPPHPSQASVIELLEDDAERLARSLNPGADLTNLGVAGAWGEDCYSGATALKVAGYQRFRENLPGWLTRTPDRSSPTSASRRARRACSIRAASRRRLPLFRGKPKGPPTRRNCHRARPMWTCPTRACPCR